MMIMMLVGEFALSLPPAARTLSVLVAVYAIIFAVKQNDAIASRITGVGAVIFNIVLTAIGLYVVVPADQLYSLNSFVSVVVGVLGSSGIHGMVKSIPATPAPPVTVVK